MILGVFSKLQNRIFGFRTNFVSIIFSKLWSVENIKIICFMVCIQKAQDTQF